MKICHYNSSEAGAVVGDKVYPVGDGLVKAGHVRRGYTMLEVIDALANNPAAMQCARGAAGGAGGVPLRSVKLLATISSAASRRSVRWNSMSARSHKERKILRNHPYVTTS